MRSTTSRSMTLKPGKRFLSKYWFLVISASLITLLKCHFGTITFNPDSSDSWFFDHHAWMIWQTFSPLDNLLFNVHPRTMILLLISCYFCITKHCHFGTITSDSDSITLEWFGNIFPHFSPVECLSWNHFCSLILWHVHFGTVILPPHFPLICMTILVLLLLIPVHFRVFGYKKEPPQKLGAVWLFQLLTPRHSGVWSR